MQKFNSITKYVLYYYAKFFYVIIGYLFVLLALLVSLQYRVFDIFYGELNYTLFLSKPELFIVIALILFATAIQSFFTTMLIYSIRKELQEGYRRTQIIEILREHTWQIFVVNLILNYVLFVIYLLLIGLKIGFLLPFVYLIIGLLTLFVNQSIIVDEMGALKSFDLSWEFIFDNKLKTLGIILIIFVLFFITSLISYYLPWGYVLGLIIMHLVIYPLFEIIKTVTYMTKFKILESYF